MINIIDIERIEDISERMVLGSFIEKLHERIHPYYFKGLGIYRAKADEDKPANDEFSMRIVINSEGTTISLSADFSKLKYPQSFIGALEEIKYKIIQQHGFIK